MSNKLPTITELSKLFIALKKHIDDGFLQVTIGWDDESGHWSFQTGDNSFMGSAYHYPHWAVVDLEPRSNTRDLARYVQDELSEIASV